MALMYYHYPKQRALCRKMGSLLALCALPLSGQAATSITLSESSGTEGGSRLVPISLETSDSISALQLDVAYDRGRVTLSTLEVGGSLSGDFALDQEAVFFDQRAVIYSPSGAALTSGTLLTVPISFSASVPEDQSVLSLNSVVLAQADGSEIEAQLMPYGRLITPTPGSSSRLLPKDFREGSPQIESVAFDTDGGLVAVEFIANGVVFALSSAAPHAIAWTPTASGDFVLSARVTDADGNQAQLGSASISVNLLEQYSDWAQEYFGSDASNPAIAGFDQDPENTGLVNLFYFALGGSPDRYDPELLPKVEVAEAAGDFYSSLVYRKPRDIEGVTYKVEVVDDLSSTTGWNSGLDYTSAPEIIEDGAIQTIRVRSQQSTSESDQLFMRLVIEAE